MSELDLRPFKIEFDIKKDDISMGNLILAYHELPRGRYPTLFCVYDWKEPATCSCICVETGQMVSLNEREVLAIYRINKFKY